MRKRITYLIILSLALSGIVFGNANVKKAEADQNECYCVIPYATTASSLKTQCIISNFTSDNATLVFKVLSAATPADIPSDVTDIWDMDANSTMFLNFNSIYIMYKYTTEDASGVLTGLATDTGRYAGELKIIQENTTGGETLECPSEGTAGGTGANFTISCLQNNPSDGVNDTKRALAVYCSDEGANGEDW
ncbi:secreted protein [Candidatus Magnetoovum chiemensis]|nr:secreted protein [Candidatus Magnetoovum chiemensis]